MELELGLKITHTRDDLTSNTDFRIAKNPFGPLFWSKETDTMFILIIHLRGFRRENIEIEINKDGNRMVISGRKPVQEMVLIKWIMWKKEVELRAFRKVFRIPDVVNLDRIKAKFNEEESTLKITLPKKVKGICGVTIEEENQEEEFPDREEAQRTETAADGESSGEVTQEKYEEPMMEVMEDSGLVVEEEVEKKQPEEMQEKEVSDRKLTSAEESTPREEFEEKKDLSIEILEKEGEEDIIPETSEEPKIQKDVEEKVEKEEPKVMQNAEDQMPGSDEAYLSEEPEEPEVQVTPEKVPEPEPEPPKEPAKAVVEEEAPEPELPKESETRTPEEAAPLATTVILEAIEPQRDIDKPATEPLPIEETQKEEPPDTGNQPETEKVPEEEVKPEEAQAGDAGDQPNPPSTEVQEKERVDGDHQKEDGLPEKSDKKEDSTEVQESTKPDQEPEEEENRPPDQPINNEVHEQVEVPGIEEEIKEGAGEMKPPEDNQKDLSEGEKRTRKSKKPRLCPPLVIAGSALFLSLIVIVINFIRSKKN